MIVPEGKFQCTGCRGIFSEEEQGTDGEEAQDWNDMFYCNECDTNQENPYCGDCVIWFENASQSYCGKCLDAALKEAKNLKGHVVERIVEKVVEKPVYINDGSAARENSGETMEEFEKRIMG